MPNRRVSVQPASLTSRTFPNQPTGIQMPTGNSNLPCHVHGASASQLPVGTQHAGGTSNLTVPRFSRPGIRLGKDHTHPSRAENATLQINSPPTHPPNAHPQKIGGGSGRKAMLRLQCEAHPKKTSPTPPPNSTPPSSRAWGVSLGGENSPTLPGMCEMPLASGA
jgi:hypothetical protein